MARGPAAASLPSQLATHGATSTHSLVFVHSCMSLGVCVRVCGCVCELGGVDSHLVEGGQGKGGPWTCVSPAPVPAHQGGPLRHPFQAPGALPGNTHRSSRKERAAPASRNAPHWIVGEGRV